MTERLIIDKFQKRQTKKNDLQSLNATFERLRDKIEEAQGTKYQFYKLNKDRTEERQQKRSLSTTIEEVPAYEIKKFKHRKNIISQTIDQETITLKKQQPKIDKISCMKCGNYLQEDMMCQCLQNKCYQLKAQDALDSKVKVSTVAAINSLYSISAKSRAITAQHRSRANNSLSLNRRNLYDQNSTSFDKSKGNRAEDEDKMNNNNMSFLQNSFHTQSIKISNNNNVFSPKNFAFSSENQSLFKNNILQNDDLNFNCEGWLKERKIVGTMDLQEMQKLAGQSENIHSLSVDDVLDLYSTKCLDNKMEYIPEQATTFILRIKKSCVKRCLRLGELSLGPKSANFVSELLKSNDHFSRLYLEKNQIGDEGAYSLATMIGVNTSLIHLDVGGNGIGPEGFELLFCSMLRSNTLVSVDISSKDGLNRNRLGLKGAAQLGQLLKLNPSIQFLKLASSQINYEQLKPIMIGINEGRALQILDIAGNDLDFMSAQIIMEGIQNTTLVELILANNCIGNQGLQYFQDLGVHSKFYSIETLDVSNNDISSKGLIAFFDSMHKNSSLKKLILNDNNFQTNQFTRISEFLFENTGLISLSMERCQISPEGAVCIAVGMEKNRNLTHLYLKENSVSDKGAKAFSDTLSHKCFLKVLDLSLCKIEDEGGIVLAASLAKAYHLHTLLLRENNIHSCVGAVLCNSLEKNTNLRKLGLERNPINYSYLEKINASLKNNQILYESKKIPLYNDILASMKGNPNNSDGLTDQMTIKKKQIIKYEKDVEVLKDKLQKLLIEEEQKMMVVETERESVQEEFNYYESIIQNISQHNQKLEHKNAINLQDSQINVNQLKQEQVKMTAQIAQKKAFFQKRREELMVKKLNLQSKLREADTQAKQSFALLQKAQTQRDQLKLKIEEKKQKLNE